MRPTRSTCNQLHSKGLRAGRVAPNELALVFFNHLSLAKLLAKLLAMVFSIHMDTPGCFGGGDPDITPNIDRLALEGIRFEAMKPNEEANHYRF